VIAALSAAMFEMKEEAQSREEKREIYTPKLTLVMREAKRKGKR